MKPSLQVCQLPSPFVSFFPSLPQVLSHVNHPITKTESVHDLDFFDDILVDISSNDARGEEGRKVQSLKVVGMPGKHVPPGPGGVMGKMNDLINAVSPFVSSEISLSSHGNNSPHCSFFWHASAEKKQIRSHPPMAGW